MTMPQRIRLSRARGFDLEAHSLALNGLPAVHVARPGPWGNPFIVGKDGDREQCVDLYTALLSGLLALAKSPDIEALKASRSYVGTHLDELRGKNLACWCALDGKPCHADILLKIANRPICEEAI
ncbi:protein of unknown function [Phyllobacterium sp. YR620]|uniref:DUF4326 domain-containing protein n=1 Tax=Phyllobacterium sp. YR620 TaxID=1881066 RepID=UPI000883AE2E|nr:DUF4326 domain-containing protein [Phyllobacterium sp. YR620]SDP92274.1 protein of unknown function [Phyllobacterium sp. YR620]